MSIIVAVHSSHTTTVNRCPLSFSTPGSFYCTKSTCHW